MVASRNYRAIPLEVVAYAAQDRYVLNPEATFSVDEMVRARGKLAPRRVGHPECTVSTTLTGTLVEIRDTFLVLDGNTHIVLPPGMKVEDLVIGERLMITATSQRGRWTAETIERYPV